MASTSLAPSAPAMSSRVIDRIPFHYSWVILAAGTFGLMMTIPGQTIGVSVFLDPMIADLGLSRSQVSLMYMVGTLVASLWLSFVGRFIDRKGPRLAVVIISGLFACACVGMGFVNGLVTLGLGFLTIRALGQGGLGLVSRQVINLWFVKRRGFALGLMGVGFALASSLVPLLITGLVAGLGWRMAYMALGLVIALTILPIGAIFYRGRPELFGLQPDGSLATADGKRASSPIQEKNVTAAVARRTLVFWLFAGGTFSMSMLGTALMFHHFSIMEAAGLDRATAALVLMPIGFVKAAANFTTGILMDRMAPRRLLVIMLGLLVLALIMPIGLTGVAGMLAYACVLGWGVGMSVTINSGVYAYYFGRLHLGTIMGQTATLTVIGSALGPFAFAYGLERFGNYSLTLGLSALMPLAIGVFASLARIPDSFEPSASDPSS
ncbi:MAG: MFS transporter [Cyanophyceae cyanobacterium]